MTTPSKVFTALKPFIFITHYALGFIHWLAGAHCWKEDSKGHLRLNYSSALRHFSKVFLWSLEVYLLFNLFGAYRDWLMKAVPSEIAMAFLVKSVVFLYLKVFWPGIFPEILPGMHRFFCPQCYRRQSFRFFPISIKLGNYVTYLCGHCRCIVDGWGNQIFYPARRVLGHSWFKFSQSLVLSLTFAALGFCAGMWVWSLF